MANRVSYFCAAAVLGAAGTCLLVWATLWQPLGVLRIPSFLYLVPTSALVLGLAGFALLDWSRTGVLSRRSRGLAVAVVVLGSTLLLEHVLMLPFGIETPLFGGAVSQLLPASGSARPSALACVCMVFIGVGLLISCHPHKGRFAPCDVFSYAVLCCALTLILGYLYQAPVLVDPDGSLPMSFPAALLMLLQALGMLAMNPKSAQRDAAGPRRKLIPAAVLIPALLGGAQAVAVRAGLLDPVLAVALTSVIGILVSVILIEWVAMLLSEREQEKEGELLQRETRAREEGMTDELTGLLNRRGWETRLKAMEDLYKREGGNACVIVIDLDGLKTINDTQGHGAGDVLIRRAGRALEAAGRREDFVARIGGDEFVYLAVDCQPQHADIVMTRLSTALARAQVQASLGYAMRDLAGSLPGAFKEADQAMYADKRARKARKQQTAAAPTSAAR